VHIFDDYGHHPVEIKAVLRAARDATKGRIIAIAQPHRFTRLRDLFDDFSACFNDADTVMVAPVYTAGEDPIDGVTSDALVGRIRSGGHRDARYITGPEQIAPVVRGLAKPGDFVVFLGAGNITQWAYALPKDLGGGTGA
jgi:UDP-N-acetylmuramate--alanine ligase